MAVMNSRRWAIVALTLTTAVIHLILFTSGWVIMLLNGLGYLVLLAALYFFPPIANMRSAIRWGLIGYTAVTFALYFIFNWPDIWGPLGLIDKAVELALIVLLYQDTD